MEKITIPNVGTFESGDLLFFFLRLSRLNGTCHHFDLTSEEHEKLKVATMSAIRDIFSRIDYTECESCIRLEHRTFDENDLARFYRNMWSHKKKWYHVCLSRLLPHRLYKYIFPYIPDSDTQNKS